MKQKISRFLRYSIIGVSTFLLDLLLLWIFTEVLGFSYLVVVPTAFFFVASLNYFISRHKVFKGTERGVKEGYLYFFLIILSGSLVMVFLMYFMVDILYIDVFISRVIVAGFVGVYNFSMNDKFNFKM